MLAAAAIFVAAVVVVALRRVPAPPVAPLVAEPVRAAGGEAPVARAVHAPPLPRPEVRASVSASDTTLALAQLTLAAGSLRGATPDGALTLDAGGRLQIDRALRRRYDWYLSLVGELAPGAIRALVEADAERELGLVPAAEAVAVFDRYVAYLDAETRLDDAPALAARLAMLRALRRSYLGEHVAEAFYGEEERYAAATLARLAGDVANGADGAAGADTTEAALAVTRAERRDIETAVLSAEHEAQLDAFGADAAQRDAERTALWGQAAAQRLAALDAANADWARRIAAYRLASAAIRSDARLGPAERTRALATLREREFEPSERLRVEALEAIGRLDDAGER